MPKIRLFIVAVFLLILADSAHCAYASSKEVSPGTVRDPFTVTVLGPNFKRLLLGTAKVNKLEKYAIVKEASSGKKFLYNKGDWLNKDLEIMDIFDSFVVLRDANNKRYIDIVSGIPYKGFEFIKTAELNEFSYSYLLVDEEPSIEESMFELTSIRGYKAALEKKYRDITKKVSEKERREPSIDEKFLSQLKTKKISDNTWIVDSQSVETPIIDSAQEAVASVVDKVSSVGFGKNGLQLGLSSNVCSGKIDREGFLVDELRPQVIEKAGLQRGDMIKTVNGKKVFNIIDLMFLFLDIRNGSTTEVNVEISRAGKPLTLKYIID